MGNHVSQICLQATAHEDYGDYYFKGDRRTFLLLFFPL